MCFIIALSLFAICYTQQQQCRKVFVTSTVYQGNLGGLEGADKICNDLAKSSSAVSWIKNPVNIGLEKYLAWLSTSNSDAIDRLGFTSETCFVLSNNASLAKDRKDFLDGSLDNSVSRDEKGNSVSSTPVWTSTTQNGVYSTSNDGGSCKSWTSNDNEEQASYGSCSLPTKGEWTLAGTDACDNNKRLYCFSITLPTPAPTPTRTREPTSTTSTSFPTTTLAIPKSTMSNDQCSSFLQCDICVQATIGCHWCGTNCLDSSSLCLETPNIRSGNDAVCPTLSSISTTTTTTISMESSNSKQLTSNSVDSTLKQQQSSSKHVALWWPWIIVVVCCCCVFVIIITIFRNRHTSKLQTDRSSSNAPTVVGIVRSDTLPRLQTTTTGELCRPMQIYGSAPRLDNSTTELARPTPRLNIGGLEFTTIRCITPRADIYDSAPELLSSNAEPTQSDSNQYGRVDASTPIYDSVDMPLK